MKVFTQSNFVAEFHLERMPVLLVKQRISVSEPPYGGSGLTCNVCDSSLAGWKACSRLPTNIIEYISLSLKNEALIRLNRPLLKGWVTFGLNIRLKGYIYPQHIYTVR